jgi:hypothetical protein
VGVEGRECDSKVKQNLAWEESLSIKESASLYVTNADNSQGLRRFLPIVDRLYYAMHAAGTFVALKGKFELESLWRAIQRRTSKLKWVVGDRTNIYEGVPPVGWTYYPFESS